MQGFNLSPVHLLLLAGACMVVFCIYIFVIPNVTNKPNVIDVPEELFAADAESEIETKSTVEYIELPPAPEPVIEPEPAPEQIIKVRSSQDAEDNGNGRRQLGRYYSAQNLASDMNAEAAHTASQAPFPAPRAIDSG